MRIGEYDVLVGVNLLREGLDLPEVSLVAVLDADKEGFLRSERSLLQIAGRTARNVEGLVILYAARITNSMNVLISETNRRREIQEKYNTDNGINPQTIYKSIEEILSSTSIADMHASMSKRRSDARKSFTDIAAEPVLKYMNKPQLKELIDQMFIEMKNAARDLDFERAAELRDELGTLKEKFDKMGG